MVDIERTPDDYPCRFILRPNRSLSWRGTLWFFFSLVLISVCIALGLTWLGFWLVLPFTGLELLAVGVGLYVVACRCYQCEIISIGEDSIRIERGRGRPHQEFTLGRGWARVVLEQCPKAWYPSRLLIRSHGRAVEVGRFLEEQERQRLADELTRSLRAPAYPGAC